MVKWQPTIIVNENLAKELIEQQCSLSVTSLQVLGEGWDNIAYLVNEIFVFRFPRREFGIISMENEIALLPYIAQYISFAISYPQFIGKPSALYPHYFAGYPIIPGHSLCEVTQALISDKIFVQQLAQWLRELHSVPILKEHLHNVKGDQSWRLAVPQRIVATKETIISYLPYFTAASFSKEQLFNCLDTYQEIVFDSPKKVYLHGDLYCRHIMVTQNLTLTGLIDFGDVHIGQPGIDLAVGIGILTHEALEVFFAIYGDIDTQTKHIAAFRVLCHSISLLPYAYEKNEKNLQIWATTALKQAVNFSLQILPF